MNIRILYEDKDIVAVDKPVGLMVHGDGRTEETTLADWVLLTYPQSKNVGEPGRTQTGENVLRSGIVHRLDRETSGVMLVAKTEKGFECLKKQFQEQAIKKEYHAFVYGSMTRDHDTIERPIGRSSKDFRKWSAQRGAKGEMREAITEYTVMARGIVRGKESDADGSEKYSFVHVFPKTGRTHQIRVHFKAIHYPLVADSLYAPGHSNTLGFTRLALHSYRITFKKTGSALQTVTAPYPEDFADALERLRKL